MNQVYKDVFGEDFSCEDIFLGKARYTLCEDGAYYSHCNSKIVEKEGVFNIKEGLNKEEKTITTPCRSISLQGCENCLGTKMIAKKIVIDDEDTKKRILECKEYTESNIKKEEAEINEIIDSQKDPCINYDNSVLEHSIGQLYNQVERLKELISYFS